MEIQSRLARLCDMDDRALGASGLCGPARREFEFGMLIPSGLFVVGRATADPLPLPVVVLWRWSAASDTLKPRVMGRRAMMIWMDSLRERLVKSWLSA